MDFLELAKQRYSVRKFSSKKVEQEKLDKILEAGRAAPTACNFQPQRIIVANNEESLGKLSKCTNCLFDAPLALIICYDKDKSFKRSDGVDIGMMDASIVTTHMMLETANLGLGCTWVELIDVSAISKEFSLPENIVPAVVMPIGYPHKDAVPHPNHAKRFDIDKTVFYNSIN